MAMDVSRYHPAVGKINLGPGHYPEEGEVPEDSSASRMVEEFNHLVQRMEVMDQALTELHRRLLPVMLDDDRVTQGEDVKGPGGLEMSPFATRIRRAADHMETMQYCVDMMLRRLEV